LVIGYFIVVCILYLQDFTTLMISGFGVPSGHWSSHKGISRVCICNNGDCRRCTPLRQILKLFCTWRTLNNCGKGTSFSLKI